MGSHRRRKDVDHRVERIDDQPAAALIGIDADDPHLRGIQNLFQFDA